LSEGNRGEEREGGKGRKERERGEERGGKRGREGRKGGERERGERGRRREEKREEREEKITTNGIVQVTMSISKDSHNLIKIWACIRIVSLVVKVEEEKETEETENGKWKMENGYWSIVDYVKILFLKIKKN
jgi:hypothetical protein